VHILQDLDGSTWFYRVLYGFTGFYGFIIWFYCKHDLATLRPSCLTMRLPWMFSWDSHAHPAGSEWRLALRLFREMPLLKLLSDVYTCAIASRALWPYGSGKIWQSHKSSECLIIIDSGGTDKSLKK
jgi:hypothetical protein